MKLAYRITTPIFAVAAIAMGIFFKLFQFIIGGVEETLDSIVTIAQALGVQTDYQFSAFELIKMIANAPEPGTMTNIQGEEVQVRALTEIIAPLMPQLIAFFVFLVITLIIFIAIGIVAATKGKTKPVILLSIGGIVTTFICIFVSNSAFAIITGGEIPLNELISLFSDNALMQLATLVIGVKTASLSYGFYALFGMFILIIFWSILTQFVINSPSSAPHRSHRRKKPMKKISAVVGTHKTSTKQKKKAKKAKEQANAENSN